MMSLRAPLLLSICTLIADTHAAPVNARELTTTDTDASTLFTDAGAVGDAPAHNSGSTLTSRLLVKITPEAASSPSLVTHLVRATPAI